MTTIEFLSKLQALEIRVSLKDEKLHVSAPAGVLTTELKTALTERKPELLELLRGLRGGGQVEPPLTRAPRDQPIPLTVSQRRLWFLDQLQPGLPTYNLSDAFDILNQLDLPALKRALNELVRRHEILRTTFPAVDGVPIQRIHPPSDVPLPVVDLTRLPEKELLAIAEQYAHEDGKTPFDLVRGPLLRVKLLKLGPEKYRWLLSIHHIISDAWSKKLLNEELEALYIALLSGERPSLPELPIQWADFAIWQERRMAAGALQADIEYWARQLEGELTPVKLPKDYSGQPVPVGAHGVFSFPRPLAADLKALCESEGVTMFMTLLAGYAVLIYRVTRQSDIIVGSPISDRGRMETESLIGFFLNTLPLRVRIDEDTTFRGLLQQVKKTCLEAYSHPAVPYESLLQRLHVTREHGTNPLIQTMLVLLNIPSTERTYSKLWGQRVEWGSDLVNTEADLGLYYPEPGNGTTKFDLSLSLIEGEGGIWGRVEYDRSSFAEATVVNLIERFQLLLRSAVADPSQKVGELSWLREGERERLLAAWSYGKKVEPEACRLHEIVAQAARRWPASVAVESAEEQLTYVELNRRANQLARHLRQLGVGPEERIGICGGRSGRLLVALTGVLKAGAAFVPLDLSYPSERLELIIRDAGIKLLVTTDALEETLAGAAVRVVCLDRDRSLLGAQSSEDLPETAGPNALACVLYTSGSSGRAKGVMLAHRGLVNYALDAARDYEIVSADRILQFASIAFDASLEEIFSTFSRGATLVLRPERLIDSVAGFVEHCRKLSLTVLMLPTAYWHELVAALGEVELPTIVRCVVIGGERALPEKLARWQRLVERRVALFNTYGPTEGSIAITRGRLPSKAAGEFPRREVTIGTPVANGAVYVLDAHLNPAPAGIPGEIFIGGAPVALGYVNQPDLTARAFVPDLFSGVPGATLYRTGDLARFLPDGTLEYCGRMDDQVKIRGHRIEPREIEAVLLENPAVKEAVVIAWDQEGEKRLVAYIVTLEPGDSDPAPFRGFLKAKLPAYMVPATFVVLPQLPLNVNGKIDRQALPRPDFSRAGVQPAELRPPRTSTEKMICEIWKSVLKLENVGTNEDFFALGGHSLLATQIVAQVNKAMKVDVPLIRFVEAPTIADLARVVDELAAGGPLDGPTTDDPLLEETNQPMEVLNK